MKKSELFDPTKPIPSGSQWQKILLEIYRHAPHQYGYSIRIPNNSDNHPLAKKLGISGYELMLGISFLQDQELIKDRVVEGSVPVTYWILEKKGFDVALDLRKFHAEHLLQRGLGYFTIVIGFTGIFQLIAELKIMNPWIIFGLYGMAIMVLCVSIFWGEEKR